MNPEAAMIIARARQQALLDEARHYRLAASARHSSAAAGPSRGHSRATAWQRLTDSLAIAFGRVAAQI